MASNGARRRGTRSTAATQTPESAPPRAPPSPWSMGIAALVLALLCALTWGWVSARQSTAAAEGARAAAEREAFAMANSSARAAAEGTAEAERVARAAAAEQRAAFQAAEAWRQAEGARLYANMTEQDWDTAARWKLHAAPDAPERTCAQPLPQQLLQDLLGLSAALARLPTALSNASRTSYLALLAHHSTGLEGNTLTLQEAVLTVQGLPLQAGLHPSALGTPAAALSAEEVRNAALLWQGLRLAELPREGHRPVPLGSLTLPALIDMNSAITRGTGTPTGLRRRHVAIGHKRTMLPMPDEVPVLMREFLEWQASSLAAAASAALPEPAQLQATLALACNAHTRFVFIHPFADGNGRLARTLSALVLQHGSLPAPLILRQHRSQYMDAVSAATIERDYAPLALLHAQAVHRSLSCLAELLWGQEEQGGGGSAAGRAEELAMAARGGGCQSGQEASAAMA